MLELKNITKVYEAGTTQVEALKGINIAFRENEFVAILGQSGCGKTTLLNIIGGLDQLHLRRPHHQRPLHKGVTTTATGTPTATTPSALSFRATTSSRTRACWPTSSSR